MGKIRATTLACFLGMVIGSANILASIQSPLEVFSSYSLTCPYLTQAEEQHIPRGGAYSRFPPHPLSWAHNCLRIRFSEHLHKEVEGEWEPGGSLSSCCLLFLLTFRPTQGPDQGKEGRQESSTTAAAPLCDTGQIVSSRWTTSNSKEYRS